MREGPTVSHPIPAPDNDAAPTPEAIRQQLEWILASATFANAPSQTAMLRYVVELSLAGEADRLKEYTLGVEVFGRGADFDPRQDTIVRVQGRRLRDRLDDYYRQEGVGDPVVISLPKGHYVPAFHCRNVQDIPVSATAEVAPPPLSKLRRWAPTVLVLGGLAVVLMVSEVRSSTVSAIRPGRCPRTCWINDRSAVCSSLETTMDAAFCCFMITTAFVLHL